MRKLCVLLWCLLAGALTTADVRAQDPGIIYFQHRQFKIPFKNDQKGVNVAQVRLYVSSDQGRHWLFTSNAPPEEQHFRFSTPSDGYFWFAVQTVDALGKLYPPTLEELKPSLKVIVDTLPPTIQVQPLQPRATEVGVAWLVRDDNLDPNLPDSVRVEYRVAGAQQWIPLTVPQGAHQIYWNPATNAQIDVRVLARDRAGNVGEEKTTVRLQAGGGGGGNPFQNPVQQPLDDLKDLPRKFVNSKQISLGYNLKDVGPSGVSTVELWYTLYKGRTWNKLKDYAIEKDAEPGPRRLAFEVQDEGVFGITLVAKSGVGLGDRPPQPNDAPQFWLEVDLTKPVVQILGVHVGDTDRDKGKLSIVWTAHDKNLAPTPIRLSYAEQRDGPWTTIADKLGNSGKHIWTMPGPQELPFQFFVRVEASDRAGNIGEAITPERVKVDLSRPKAQPLDIIPSGR